MESEEIAHLKSENARLNKIIDVLLNYNALLNVQIAIAKVWNSLPNTGTAIAEVGNGIPNIKTALAEIINGNPNIRDALAEIYNGNPNLEAALAEIYNGNPNVRDSVAENSKGSPNVPKPLPDIINPSNGMRRALWHLLKANGFNKVRHKAIENAVLMLIHFHNKKSGDHSGLRKLTGLSEFGMAKFIRSLKKRGLIVSNGWQQFSITSNANDMIRQAWEKTDGMKGG